jgi:drug/metabolite transporter (DMT)-like permease
VDGKVGRYCVEGVFKELMGLLLIVRSQIQRDPFMLKEFGNRLQKPGGQRFDEFGIQRAESLEKFMAIKNNKLFFCPRTSYKLLNMGGPALSQKSGYAGQPLPQGEILTTKRALQQRKTPDWQHDRKIDMLNAETLAITYGIGSALAWGAGDFSGGFATKRGSVFTVILYSQIIGGLLLVGLQVLWGERPPEFRHLAWGGAAGLFGVLGLVALYKGLATGRMGIVAPLSAVLTAVVPLLFAFVVEGIPKSTQLIGFGGALMAVWLFSSTRGPGSALKSEILLSLSAGLGFGLFFICIDRVSGEAILWPLIAARCASVVTMALVLGCRGQLCLPHSSLWPLSPWPVFWMQPATPFLRWRPGSAAWMFPPCWPPCTRPPP